MKEKQEQRLKKNFDGQIFYNCSLNVLKDAEIV